MAATEDATPELEEVSVETFLESIPPGRASKVSGLKMNDNHLRLPTIELHCNTPGTCEGPRQFRQHTTNYVQYGQRTNIFEQFVCRNCEKTLKTFALQVIVDIKGHG